MNQSKTLLFTLLVTLLVSCSTEPAIDYVLLSGQIENPLRDKLIIRGGDFRREIPVSKDGSFSDTLRVEKGYYSFSHSENSNFYLAPGQDLRLLLNTEQFDETIEYEGIGSEINNYLAKKVLKEEALIASYTEFYKMEEQAFAAKALELKSAYEEMLERIKSIDPEFYAIEKKNILYDYLSNLAGYEGGHRYYANERGFNASGKLLVALEGFDFDNAVDYKTYASYRNILSSTYADYMALKGNPDIVLSYLNDIKKLTSENIRNGLMEDLSFHISPSFARVHELYQGIIEISSDTDFKSELSEKYEKVKNLIPGQPAPEFNYISNEGKMYTMKDLRGKYVYFDIWATWCGPCLREIPHLKAIEEKYKKANVQFVSVSIDSEKDIEKWKAFIIEKDLGGLQLYAEGEYQAKIMTDYTIEGIPRFLLIDPDGNIVSADAPRPSDPKLAEMLNELTTQS